MSANSSSPPLDIAAIISLAASQPALLQSIAEAAARALPPSAAHSPQVPSLPVDPILLQDMSDRLAAAEQKIAELEDASSPSAPAPSQNTSVNVNRLSGPLRGLTASERDGRSFVRKIIKNSVDSLAVESRRPAAHADLLPARFDKPASFPENKAIIERAIQSTKQYLKPEGDRFYVLINGEQVTVTNTDLERFATGRFYGLKTAKGTVDNPRKSRAHEARKRRNRRAQRQAMVIERRLEAKSIYETTHSRMLCDAFFDSNNHSDFWSEIHTSDVQLTTDDEAEDDATEQMHRDIVQAKLFRLRLIRQSRIITERPGINLQRETIWERRRPAFRSEEATRIIDILDNGGTESNNHAAGEVHQMDGSTNRSRTIALFLRENKNVPPPAGLRSWMVTQETLDAGYQADEEAEGDNGGESSENGD